MTAERPGKKLESIVAALERVLHPQGANIEAPCRRLLDRDTGKPREHDVVITWDHGHHQIVTAVECRDRSRPVGVPEVEAFADKCAATGVHSGVIVSATGFYDSARKKAAARSIICMELSDIESFDWLGTNTIDGYERKIERVSFQLPIETSQEAFQGKFYDPTMQEVTVWELADHAISNLPREEDRDANIGKRVTFHMRLPTIGWKVRGPDGDFVPLSHVDAKITTVTSKTEIPIKTHRYQGDDKGYSVATAELPVPGLPGHLVILEKEDGSADIFIVPKNPVPNKP